MIKVKRRQMSRDEEAALARKAQAGDLAARDLLVVNNLPLVTVIARKHSRSSDWEDILADGAIGILRAVKTFDPSKGRFSTHACWWIRAEVNRRMARRAGVTTDSYGRWTHQPRSDVPLEEVQEFIAAEVEGPDAGLHRNDLRLQVERAIWRARLNKQERAVLRGRLLCDEPKKLREVGAELGVSRERVRQVEVQVRAKMAEVLAKVAA